MLRRPPFGTLAPGAHDMKREFKVLSRLWRVFDRAPRALLFCDDAEVAGADFFEAHFEVRISGFAEAPGLSFCYGELPERAWAESRAATEGLTSDDVHRKGSLAVQAMLRWLEVARLTRNSGAVEKLEGELELQRVQESRG